MQTQACDSYAPAFFQLGVCYSEANSNWRCSLHTWHTLHIISIIVEAILPVTTLRLGLGTQAFWYLKRRWTTASRPKKCTEKLCSFIQGALADFASKDQRGCFQELHEITWISREPLGLCAIYAAFEVRGGSKQPRGGMQALMLIAFCCFSYPCWLTLKLAAAAALPELNCGERASTCFQGAGRMGACDRSVWHGSEGWIFQPRLPCHTHCTG